MSDFKPGDKVTWMREARGGYGYVEPIPGTVVRECDVTVYITVKRADGVMVHRWVKPENLRPA